MSALNDDHVYSHIPPSSRDGFRIAIICALPLEAQMVVSVMDQIYNHPYGKAAGDMNTYTTGVLARHNVVLAYMSKMGGNSAAVAASGLRSSFTRVEIVLSVGICGVVPIHSETAEEICLGDCVISTGLVQYDYGRRYPNGFARKSEACQEISHPEIRSLLAKLSNPHGKGKLAERLTFHLQKLQTETARDTGIQYPGVDKDRLFLASYPHKHTKTKDEVCAHCDVEFDTCKEDCDTLKCDTNQLIPRKRLLDKDHEQKQYVHFGRFGSANTVLRSGADRDQLATKDSLAAFEMEGAGISSSYSSVLVVKAACDYADSHKSKEWQTYAAASAAAATKAVLEKLEVTDELGPTTIRTTLGSSSSRADTDVLKSMPAAALWLLPFGRDEDFTGRKDILKDLWQRYENRRAGYQLRLALVGMGGIGKSQIAIEFAHQLHEKYKEVSIFWIHANTVSRFEQGYEEIALKAGLATSEESRTSSSQVGRDLMGISSTNGMPKSDKSQLVEVVHRYLSDKLDNWIMVLDNVDDRKIFATPRENTKILRDFLSNNPKGIILITSRNRDAAVNLVGGRRIMDIDAMPLEESMDLIKTKLDLHDDDEKDAHDLLESLDYLPLAITQVAAYIVAKCTTIRRYLSLLRSERSQLRLLNDDSLTDPRRDNAAARTVMATWQISFEAIVEQHPYAAELLKLLCMYDNQSIPIVLLQTWHGLKNKADHTDNLDDEAEVQKSSVDALQMELEAAISVLASYSLVKLESSSLRPIKLHRLVQLSMRSFLKAKDELRRWESNAIYAMSICFKSGLYDNLDEKRLLLPHAEKAVKYKPRNVRKSGKLNLIERLALHLRTIGRYAEAVHYARVQVTMAEEAEKNSPQTIFGSLVLLALHLPVQGQFREVDKIIDRIKREYGQRQQSEQAAGDKSTWTWLPVFQKGGVLHNPNSLADMINFARLLALNGEHSACKPLYEYILQHDTQRNVSERMRSMLDYANSLAQSGDLDKAEKLHNEVWEYRKTTFGENHQLTLNSANEVAKAMSRRGSFEAAEVLYHKIYLAELNNLGEHPNTLTTLGAIGFEQSFSGRYGESIRTFRDVIMRADKALGKHNHISLSSKHRLANALFHNKKHDEAEMLCREALQDTEAMNPDWSAAYRGTTLILCMILEAKDEFDQAETYRRELLATSLKLARAGERINAVAMHNVGYVLQMQDKTVEAEIFLRDALSHFDHCPPYKITYTYTTVAWLCENLRKQGRYQEANDLLKKYHQHQIDGVDYTEEQVKGCFWCNEGYTLDFQFREPQKSSSRSASVAWFRRATRRDSGILAMPNLLIEPRPEVEDLSTDELETHNEAAT